MKGLLIKDFRFMIQRKRFFLMLLLLAVTMSFYAEGTGMISYLVLISVLFSVSTLSYDEYDNCYTFLMTLPIMKKTYVQEKYLLGWVMGILAWAVGCIIFAVMGLIRPAETSLLEVCFSSILFVPAGVLINDITFPFQLKYGMERGRLAMFVTMGLLFGLVLALQKIITISAEGLPQTILNLLSQNAAVIMILAFALVLAATYLSYRISVGIMKKKEL